MRSLVKNIGCLATAQGKCAKCGAEQGQIKLLSDACIIIEDGLIAEVIQGNVNGSFDEVIDANGLLVTPGLVDSHTHLVFGGWREHELADKLKGVTYLEILSRGGGILNTLENTRKASEQELFEKAKQALALMLEHGTTTCEAKSGYCLETQGELKQLRVIKRLNESQPVSLVPTFMGAHAVPKEFKENKSGYIDVLINEMLPAVKAANLAEYCDIFCETGVFDAAESKEILEAAKKLGFGLKIHADEIDAIGGSELCSSVGAISAEHLIAITEGGMNSLASAGTVAVLLPATSFYLDKPFAPARRMIEHNIPVAIATDFNPGSCPNLSLQLPMNLGCLRYKMTPEEVLTAVTLNAAVAIGRADSIGSIESNKTADLVIWNSPNLDRLFYRFGHNQTLAVIKNGIRIK